MISSNIDEILLKNQANNSFDKSINNEPFVNSLIDTKLDEVKNRTSDFTYENIKGITLEEIEEIFSLQEDKQMAKNLRLATLFTEDENLGQALFNTVLGQPFSLGLNYLYESYEDKHNFLNSFSNKSSSFSDIFHESITKRVVNKNSIEVIPQEYIDEILLKVNSFSFLSTLTESSKEQYGRYKDKEDSYSFLYNDYYLKYQELMYKYDELQSFNKNMINQFK